LKRPRKPTPKQQRFILEYIANGLNATQAALKAYPNATYATARVIGCENLTKPNVKGEIELLLRTNDLTLRDALRPLVEGLKATDGFGNPDHRARLQAGAQLMKLHGVNNEGEPAGHNQDRTGSDSQERQESSLDSSGLKDLLEKPT